MQISEELRGSVDVISLEGKLIGGEEVTALHSTIKSCLEDKTNKIIIDLKDLKWIGSVGIGILICCLTTVRNAGGELRLTGLSEKVDRLLLMTKLNHVFDVYPTIDKAVASFDVH